MSKYKFEEIAINCTQKKMPTEEDRPLYIGLEHLDTGNLHVDRWGSSVPLKGEKLIMRKNDVLLGKRNAYLRRAAVAPHDGIFSAHGMVLQPREDVVDKDFFPLFIASDYFFDEAIRISVGSLSPTINWKDLRGVEFELPNLGKQRELAKLLWAMDTTKKSYQNLLLKTDELVRAQFIELFGGSRKYEAQPLSQNVIEMFIGPFGSALKNSSFVEKESGFCIVYEQKHAIQKTMDLETRYVDEQKYIELKRFTVLPGDIIVSCRGTIGEIFVIPDNAPMGIMHPSIMKIRLNEEVYDKKFFVFVLEQYMHQHISDAIGTSVKMAVTATTLGKEEFIVPAIGEQKEFVRFVEQSDKSKLELEQALVELTATYKKILSENLG